MRQRRVGKLLGGVVELLNLGAQVGGHSPHKDLHRGGKRVQVAGEHGDEGVLLPGGAQREVHRARDRDDRQTVAAEVDHANPGLAGDGAGRQPQRRRILCVRGRPSVTGAAGGTGGQPGRWCDHTFGGVDPVTRAGPLADRGGQQPIQGQPVALAQYEDTGASRDGHGEHRQRHQSPGRRPDEVEHHGGQREDQHLTGGQVRDDPVLTVNIGGYVDGMRYGR